MGESNRGSHYRASALPLDFSQFTNRKPPGASKAGVLGAEVTCNWSSSTGRSEQSQQSNAQSLGRRVRERSMTWTMALSVTSRSFLYKCANAHSASELWMVGTSGVWTPEAPW